jgi:hypothetical protein
MQGESDLFDVVLAFEPGGGFADSLNAGEREPEEYADDGDDDE